MASRTFGPPGCATHQPMSARLRPWSPRKASTSPRTLARTRSGTSTPRTMRRPEAPTSQPIARSLSGYSLLRVATTVGRAVSSERPAPTMTTAAAPSPKRPLATRFATDVSSRCTVRLHSSTESSTATSSGWPTRWSCTRATPAAPATHPRPTRGTRLTSSRRPMRAATRASSDGTASPVIVVDTIRSTSAGERPASARAWHTTAAPRSTATRMNSSLASPKSASAAYRSSGSAR